MNTYKSTVLNGINAIISTINTGLSEYTPTVREEYAYNNISSPLNCIIITVGLKSIMSGISENLGYSGTVYGSQTPMRGRVGGVTYSVTVYIPYAQSGSKCRQLTCEIIDSVMQTDLPIVTVESTGMDYDRYAKCLCQHIDFTVDYFISSNGGDE